MTRGLVIGKFYPPHKGHKLLIDTARSQVDQLMVIICEHPTETISGKLRASWLQAIHSDIATMIIDWEGMDESDSQLWAKKTKEWLGYTPDVVFTSEDYGAVYAKFMKTRHILVDRARKKVPISATLIRSNPLKYWNFLEPPVRAFYAQRVCILGAESTGTTTLAQALAKHYHTAWVPEFGRMYWEGKLHTRDASTWKSAEFEFIAKKQNELEDELVKYSNKLLICDTDSFATTLWHERYMGYSSQSVENLAKGREYALYIVTDVDIPFVQDGTRDGEKIRVSMHKRFIAELKKWNKPYIVVAGSRKKRLHQSTQAIDKILA